LKNLKNFLLSLLLYLFFYLFSHKKPPKNGSFLDLTNKKRGDINKKRGDINKKRGDINKYLTNLFVCDKMAKKFDKRNKKNGLDKGRRQ